MLRATVTLWNVRSCILDEFQGQKAYASAKYAAYKSKHEKETGATVNGFERIREAIDDDWIMFMTGLTVRRRNGTDERAVAGSGNDEPLTVCTPSVRRGFIRFRVKMTLTIYKS